MGACIVAEAGVAFAATKPPRTVIGDRRAVFLDVTMSASYATGGDSIDLSPWFKINLDFIDIEPLTSGGTTYRPEFVRGGTPSAGKLKLYSGVGSTNAEVGSGTNLGTVSFRFMAIGK